MSSLGYTHRAGAEHRTCTMSLEGSSLNLTDTNATKITEEKRGSLPTVIAIGYEIRTRNQIYLTISVPALHS